MGGLNGGAKVTQERETACPSSGQACPRSQADLSLLVEVFSCVLQYMDRYVRQQLDSASKAGVI